MKLSRLCPLILVAVAFAATAQTTFTNPLLPTGPDPWVEYKDGWYYYMNTTVNNLTVWKTRNIADLKSAQKKVVWTPPATGPYSHDIWAPEIHFIEGKWYLNGFDYGCPKDCHFVNISDGPDKRRDSSQ